MKEFLRRALWRLLNRDCLVLRPGWKVLSRAEGHVILGDSTHNHLLPVSYNQRTGKNWRLHYRLRGNGPGQLHYRLSAPGKEPFCEIIRPCQLPWEWSLELQPNGSLQADGQPVALLPGRTLPLDTHCLIGEFELHSERGPIYSRQTAHQITSAQVADADYYNGSVYDNYDRQNAPNASLPLEMLRRFQPLRGRFLDAGCATGLLVEKALEQGLEAEGVDLSPWAVGQANQRTSQRCRVLNLDQATAADFPNRYDLIVCHSVLEHLVDPRRALQLLFDICAPNGLIYAQTLNADSLCHRLLEHDWAGLRDPTHLSPWITADWLEAAARDIGFCSLHARTYGLWNENPVDPVWRSFQSALQLHPACVLLEDRFGDFVEAVWRRP